MGRDVLEEAQSASLKDESSYSLRKDDCCDSEGGDKVGQFTTTTPVLGVEVNV